MCVRGVRGKSGSSSSLSPTLPEQPCPAHAGFPRLSALQKQSVEEVIEEERSKVDAKTPVTEQVGLTGLIELASVPP